MSESSQLGILVSIIVAFILYLFIWKAAFEGTEKASTWKRVLSHIWIIGHAAAVTWFIGSWFFQSWAELLALQ